MVIRNMIRHENDVTQHRLMWRLMVQGRIANAAVGAGRGSSERVSVFASAGILATLSAFVILYPNYQARRSLPFPGNAKHLDQRPKGCHAGDNAHALLGAFRLGCKPGHRIATAE